MEQARAEGNAIIDSHREALEKLLEDHRSEARRQSETRVKAETTNARLSLNQAAAKSQLEIKRRQGKVRLIDEYMKTEAYDDFLIRCIRHAADFAGSDPVIIYINPTDADKKDALERATNAELTVSAEDFRGGVRAVIRSRNILIDNSFKTQLRNEYDKFMFAGGDCNA